MYVFEKSLRSFAFFVLLMLLISESKTLIHIYFCYVFHFDIISIEDHLGGMEDFIMEMWIEKNVCV